MKTKKLLFLSLSSLPFALFAQEDIDYRIFMNSTYGYSAIFRGELPAGYGGMMPTDMSTYYAYSESYERGNVCFRGKLYQGIFLNLNAHIDELCAMESSPGIAIILNKNLVDSFSLGGVNRRQFVHYKQERNSVLSSGYYEVLYSGQLKLYKKIRKHYSERISTIMESVNPIQRGFTLSESFYIWKDDSWTRIATKSDLKRVFREQMRTLDNLLKSKKINLKKNMEIALLEIVTNIDT